MERPFLAVDPGTHSGIAMWVNPVRCCAVNGSDGTTVRDACTVARTFGVDTAVIEEVPIFGRHGAGLRQIATMGELAGRWVQSAEEHGLSVVRVPPATWQRAMGAMAHRGETEADRDRRRIMLATAILRAEGGTCSGAMTVDVACAVLLGAFWDRARPSAVRTGRTAT